MRRLQTLATLSLGVMLAAGTVPVAAQAYPSKPIRFVAAYPAGGPSDIVARAIGRRLSEMLGQPVVIENRAGAGGHIGAENVARSAPDGYSLLLGGSYVTIGPSLYRKLAYDIAKDFTAIGLVAAIPAVMAYNFFGRRIRVLSSEMDAFGNDFLNIVRRHFLS